MAIKENDFIELDYTGRLKENNIVFDTTSKDLAEKEGLFSQQMEYGPIVVCIGKGHLVKGLDQKIVGKDPGKYTFELAPEEAFGKKDPKLVQLIPMSKFKKDNVNPAPGLQINADGNIGIVKVVSGGRVLVDFNSPLAGKEIVYEIDIKRIVEDTKEKINALLKIILSMDDADIVVEGKKADIRITNPIPEPVLKNVGSEIKSLVGLEEIRFSLKSSEDKNISTKKD